MKKHSYYGLLATITLSGFGDAFGLLAMEWLVYEMTGSKLAMGVLALCSGIPELALRLLGSPLTDRLPREKLMAGLATLRWIAVTLPFVVGLAGQLQMWHLFLAAGLSGSCAALFMPSAMAAIPEVADNRKLMRAFAVIDGCRNAVALIGPAMAGVVTASQGALPALGINAAFYLITIATLLTLPRSQRKEKKPSSLPLATYLREMTEGFSFYKRFTGLLVIMVMVSISNMSSMAIWTMMVPYVQEVLHLDAAAMGALTTSSACGTLAGLGVIFFLKEVKQRRTVMLCSLAAMGFFNTILGVIGSFSIALVALFLAGMAGPFFGSLSSSLHGKLVPDRLQGRVNSVRFLIGGSLSPVGAFAGGAIAQHYGVQFMILIAGLLPVVCSAGALFLPVLKELNGDLSELESKIHSKTKITTMTQSPDNWA